MDAYGPIRWFVAIPWVVVVGFVVMFATGLAFLLAVVLDRLPLRGKRLGVKQPAEWGQCPECHHATPPEALNCPHCGMLLREPHHETSYA